MTDKKKPNFGKAFQIVKDPEEELYYVAIQQDYDDENERTIIAHGKTELEAIENLTIELHERYNKCFSKLKQILELVSYRQRGEIAEDLDLKMDDIERPLEFKGHKDPGFSALIWDESSAIWHRFYR